MNTSQEAGTPRTYFTSDTHFGHRNIIRYCNRPFKDTDHMDAEIVRRWNEVVMPWDIVYHLGDIALGPIDKSLANIASLNGYKIAILGNHDRPFMRMGKTDEDKWWDRYREVFQEVISWEGAQVELPGFGTVAVSHFPYTGDHTPDDRHSGVRMLDEGMPLIHGHTHTTDRLTFSKAGTPQVHVGQDAWDFRPVSSEDVRSLLDTAA